MKGQAGDILRNAENVLGVLFFVGMFGAVSIQVFSRYALGHPLVWPFEFSIYCYIYIVYIGSVMATRRRSHVAFDIVHERLPRRARLLVRIIGNMFIVAVLLTVLPSSIEYISFVGYVRSSALDIHWSWVLAIFPVSMGLVVIHLSAWTVRYIRELRSLETN
jgi:TRAP-type C4-dicarboxylate transport system permease small subunit